jgi:hypothetical protein
MKSAATHEPERAPARARPSNRAGARCSYYWFVLAIGWLCAALGARADQARSALVLAPRSDDPALIEVTARVRGELSAAGFRVFTREAPPALSPRRAVEIAGADLAPSAVLWIVAAQTHSADAPNLEIWLSDRLLGRVSMARLSSAVKGNETPSSLAVQAVELLRARLSELRVASNDDAAGRASKSDWVEQEPEPSEPVRARAQAAEAPGPGPRQVSWLGVSAGVAYLFGSGSLEGALMPAIGLAAGLGKDRPSSRAAVRFDLRLSAAGFGERERVQTALGSVRLDQAYGTLSAAARLVTRAPVEPLLSVGAGVYSLGARGSAEPPYEAHRKRHWAPLGSLGIGLRSRPFAHLSLLASAELLAAASRAELRIAGAEAARAGGAMWLVRAELQGVF